MFNSVRFIKPHNEIFIVLLWGWFFVDLTLVSFFVYENYEKDIVLFAYADNLFSQ
jgi:hypothetical protein